MGIKYAKIHAGAEFDGISVVNLTFHASVIQIPPILFIDRHNVCHKSVKTAAVAVKVEK